MPERSTGAMMFIGERCALDECHREDFLPFRCADCRQSYCGAHFRPAAHRCSVHDDSTGDYRVPLCPLCDSPPQGWKRDEDPNIAMDRHLSAGRCPALDSNGYIKADSKGPSAASSSSGARQKKPNECRFKKCSKIMVVPIQCPQCRASFCPSHRAPAQHSCGSTPSPASSSSRLVPPPPKKADAAGSSALKKMTASVSKPNFGGLTKSGSKTDAPPAADGQPKRTPMTAIANKATTNKLFDKTDKRAKAERVSAIKAMQARQKKGLLTSSEETKLAEEMASLAKISNTGSGGKKDSDCVIC
ncbi:uncharacterized protein PFL1_00192 [Pseudozyma flocculosa PF-1]|uniref:AN1-type domain-containing protein n=1 Tax=Pseudozyma flocculosa TaxID=84751 RepID=A0A5C3ERY3_9BASI|nr:uncharacterized protein PFL1_00192 [Pseudozyma flocculosa PF-1]EPQ31994.1 hypothetical protein PFL1_00192 [Pseudozyma flocculosa PF-1]SPO35083.1 uncharacterized protein PSFLO_00554 [Pseudozyma flocculosa]